MPTVQSGADTTIEVLQQSPQRYSEFLVSRLPVVCYLHPHKYPHNFAFCIRNNNFRPIQRAHEWSIVSLMLCNTFIDNVRQRIRDSV